MTSPFTHPNPGGPRSRERIWSVLADVGEYWRANPDQRLTQVILNATKRLGVPVDKAYNVEDAPLVDALRRMLAEQPSTEVTCHRLVPLSQAAQLAVTLPGPDFAAWFDRHRPALGRLSDCRVLTTDMVEALLADSDQPTDDAGVEWIANIRDALRLTEADFWRPYDSVVVPATHRVHADLAALSDEVEQTSPMLAPVVEGIDMLLHVPGNTIGAFYSIVSDRIGEEFFGDTEVRWEHIETLVPNLRERLIDVVDELLKAVPIPAADDSFAARTRSGEPQ